MVQLTDKTDLDSRSSIATDPLRNFKFLVSINHTVNGSGAGSKSTDLSKMGFMSVSGLSVETSVIAYRQGGFNTSSQKLPGQTEFPPITMSKGVIVGKGSSIDWLLQIYSVIQGGGTFLATGNNDFRSTVDIKVLAHPHTGNTNPPVKAWFRVHRAWPASVSFSDLDAGGNAVFMEQLVLQHEGWEVKYASDNRGAESPQPRK